MDEEKLPSLGDLFAQGYTKDLTPLPVGTRMRDAQGAFQINPLAFGALLKGSKVVDAQGQPLLVYRGEHGQPTPGGGFQSRLPSLSFGSREAANTYAMEPNVRADIAHAPRVTPSYLSIRNPVIHNEDDPFVDFSTLLPKFGDDFVRNLAREHASRVTNTNNWDENFSHKYDSVGDLLARKPALVRDLYMDAYPLLDDPHFIDAAKARGFDGAIHIGNGETASDLEYRIFHPSQAISPWGVAGLYR